MGKKIIVVLCCILAVVIIIPIIWGLQDNGHGNAAVIFLISILAGCICGSITDCIAKSKGYDAGFAWGFWLGVIGIIVVAVRPFNNLSEKSEERQIYYDSGTANNDIEIMIKEIMVEGLLSIQAGENPRVIEEKLKSFLAPKDREVGQGEGGEMDC